MTGVVIEQQQSPNKKSNNKIDDIATSYRTACVSDKKIEKLKIVLKFETIYVGKRFVIIRK